MEMIGIDLKEDDEIDTLLFYFTYYTFVKAERDFLFDDELKSPNKNLISYIENKNKDFLWLGCQFLMAYDIYIKATEESMHLDESERRDNIINEFCNEIAYSYYHSEEKNLSDKDSIVKAREIYDKAYIEIYYDEYKYLIERQRSLMYSSFYENIGLFYKCVTESYKNVDGMSWGECIGAEKELDSVLFNMIFYGKFIRRIQDTFAMNYDLKEDIRVELKQCMKSYILKAKKNNFLMVGSYLMALQEVRECEAQLVQLQQLKENAEKKWTEQQEIEAAWRYASTDCEFNEIPVKELLDYFIPEQDKRKASDRNTIRGRIENVKKVLRYVNICLDYADVQDIKMMYREFYLNRNGLLGDKAYASFLSMISKEEDIKMNRIDVIRLEELYIALQFKRNNEREEYIQYNQEKQKYLRNFVDEVFIEPFKMKV